MKTLRKYVAVIFVVPGVVFLGIGLAIGVGFEKAIELLEKFKNSVEDEAGE